MELKNNSGQEMISSNELHAIKRFAQAVSKFKTTYFVFNRQLNNVIKMGEKILKGDTDDRTVKGNS